METETDLTCPVCDSVNVTGDTFDMVTGAAWQDVSCDDCGSSWTDCYGFTGRQDIREGDRVDIARARQAIDLSRTIAEIDNAARDWARVNRESDYNYGSPSRWYPDAVRAGVITESELDRAREYYGDRFCYTGD